MRRHCDSPLTVKGSHRLSCRGVRVSNGVQIRLLGHLLDATQVLVLLRSLPRSRERRIL